MKKAKSGKRPSATRHAGALRTPATKPRAAKKASPKRALKSAAPQTVDEYFDRLSEPALSALHKIRRAIRSVVPPEAIEIISYKIPAFKHKKVLVWYAAFASHCSLFPTAAVIDAFKDELKGFSISKGTIHFTLDKPMPAALIKKLVKARVEQE
ncbi:MAG: hypothetical protein JWM08_2178 [Candidatus Angelobacter sp.]|nr:hypothetical protein [Candidatus Angelobacter sp.]